MTASGQDPHPLAGVFKTDLVRARKVLRDWFAGHMGNVENISISGLSRVGGLSHELVSFELEWRKGGDAQRQRLIVRIDPVQYRKRHTSNLRREFDTLSALNRTAVPTPRVYWYEPDDGLLGAEFYAMEQLAGQVPSDSPPFQTAGWVFDLTEAERRMLWQSAISTMAELHKTPKSDLTFLRRDKSNSDDLLQHLDYWRDNHAWAMGDATSEIANAAWRWLYANLPYDSPEGVCWGDARYANLMFDGLRCCAMLDWEDVALGGPLFDLGRWLFVDALHEHAGYPKLKGLGEREETVLLWERLTGLNAKSMHWFEIFHGACGVGLTVRTKHMQDLLLGKSAGPSAYATKAIEQLLVHMLEQV